MSDPDRLAEYRSALADARRGRAANPDRYPADFDAVAEMLDETLDLAERQRDLLARLEWAIVGSWPPNAPSVLRCPDCKFRQDQGHSLDCQLAAVLHPTNDEDPPRSPGGD